MSTIRISGKNLGQLNNPDCCELCFQTLVSINHSTPYNIFPGIFSTFDSMQKKLVRSHLEEHGTLPSWLTLFADGTKPAGTPYKVQYHDKATDILLVGIPDEVLVRADGSLMLLDYKTAKHTGGQDALLSLYAAQLNSYAWMLGKCGHGDVTLTGLIYFEPETIRLGKGNECFTVGFKATEVPVDIDTTMTPKLLKRARAISDLSEPAKRKENCRDCDLRDAMAAVNRSSLAIQDSLMRHMSQRERAIYFAQSRFDQFKASDAIKLADHSDLNSPSLISEWDWT